MQGDILILGKGGQLGNALEALLGKRAVILSTEQADLRQPDFTRRLPEGRFAAVINAAAYTQVDKAEGEGRTEAMRVNGDAVGELADWCKERNLPLLHVSTDYVYDGKGDAPRREDHPTTPLNAYGESKLAGDKAAARAGRCLVFRTSWIYDAAGRNFFNTMLRLFHEKESVNVVNDQVGAPTYAPHLAAGMLKALEAALALPEFPSGVYHLCNGGETSWHGFAQAIFALARKHDSGIRCQRVNPIPTTQYPTPAARPLNSRLDCAKAREILGVALPGWQDGLEECVEEKYGSGKLQARGT